MMDTGGEYDPRDDDVAGATACPLCRKSFTGNERPVAGTVAVRCCVCYSRKAVGVPTFVCDRCGQHLCVPCHRGVCAAAGALVAPCYRCPPSALNGDDECSVTGVIPVQHAVAAAPATVSASDDDDDVVFVKEVPGGDSDVEIVGSVEEFDRDSQYTRGTRGTPASDSWDMESDSWDAESAGGSSPAYGPLPSTARVCWKFPDTSPVRSLLCEQALHGTDCPHHTAHGNRLPNHRACECPRRELTTGDAAMLNRTLVLEAAAGRLSMNQTHRAPRVLRALVEHRENALRCHPDDTTEIWKAFHEAVLGFAKSLPAGSPTRDAAVEADRSGDDFADTEAGRQLYQAAMTNYDTRTSLCVGCTSLCTRLAYAGGKTARNENRVGEFFDSDFCGLICDECYHANESCGSTGYSCPEEWASAPCRLCRQAGREMLDRNRKRSGSDSDSDADAAPAARARLY